MTVAHAAGSLWRRSGLWRFALLASPACLAAGLWLMAGAPVAAPPHFSASQFQATQSSPQPAARVPAPATAALPTAAAPAAPAAAASASQTGDIDPKSVLGTRHETALDIAGRSVPLPTGDFKLRAFLKESLGIHTAYDVALTAEREGRLDRYVILFLSDRSDRFGTGFRAYPDCKRSDVYFVQAVANEDFKPQDCYLVNHAQTDVWHTSKAWNVLQSMAASLDADGIALPTVVTCALFINADADGYLRALYCFNPERQGITSHAAPTWSQSDWHVSRVGSDAEKRQYLERLRAWADAWHPVLRAAFEGGTLGQIPANLPSALD